MCVYSYFKKQRGGGLRKLDRREDETSNADAFLDFVLIADTVLGEEDGDEVEDNDEPEEE
jgi:hypothetical protein